MSDCDRVKSFPQFTRSTARVAGAFAASLTGVWCAPLFAQVPPGATPGGALPRVEQTVPPAAPQGELFEIPRVFDRPLGLD
jgi:hypothetical protein